MRIVSNCALWLALLWTLDGTQAYAQQARKWVEPDGRVTYSDVQPSKTARLAGSVKGDLQSAGAGEKIEAGKVELVEGQVSVTGGPGAGGAGPANPGSGAGAPGGGGKR